jgi:hypothetical protein
LKETLLHNRDISSLESFLAWDTGFLIFHLKKCHSALNSATEIADVLAGENISPQKFQTVTAYLNVDQAHLSF